MAANTPHEEIRSFLARTNGGYAKPGEVIACYAVVFEHGMWHVLLAARSTEGAQECIARWTQRTGLRTAVIVNAAELANN